MNVLLTGSTGFVGGRIKERMLASDWRVTAAVRDGAPSDPRIESWCYAGLDGDLDWRESLADQSVVVHCAARVHVMQDKALNPLYEFRKVNVDGTLQLARQAADAGVRRFVFMSSIKVNGEATPQGHAYTAHDIPAPIDPYGVSKWEAEQGLRDLAAQTGMEVTIIRPVLVYGPGVKGNFRTMMALLSKGLPLPLGAVRNSRSLVALDNLVDLVVTCVEHPAAANQTFLVSDGEDISTTELLRRISIAMNRSARLLPIPSSWLLTAAALVGKADVARRLCGSLQVDIAHTCNTLGWRPPVLMEQAIQETVSDFCV